jgi:hypothetical protein
MSCLVAWGLVLVVEPRVGWQRETTVKDSVGYIYVGHRTVRAGAEHWLLVRSSMFQQDRRMEGARPERPPWVGLPDEQHLFAITDVTGWPLPCLVCRERVGGSLPVYEGTLDWKPIDRTLRFPMRPAWSGLTIDALIFGAAAFAVNGAVRARRRLGEAWRWYVGTGSMLGAVLRLGLRVCEFVLVGALFTLLASWGLVLMELGGIRDSETAHLRAPRARDLVVVRERGFGHQRWSVGYQTQGAEGDLPRWVQEPPVNSSGRVTEAWGWPAVCLAWSADSPARLPSGVVVTYEDALEAPLRGKTFELPLRRVWGGIAVDVVFYGFVFAAIGVGAAWVRRGRQRKRGRCVWCGYDCAGVTGDVCPECGRAWGRECTGPKLPPYDDDHQGRDPALVPDRDSHDA